MASFSMHSGWCAGSRGLAEGNSRPITGPYRTFTSHDTHGAFQKGDVSFMDGHDHALMQDPVIFGQRAKVELVADRVLMDPAAPRGSVVEVTLSDGRKV